MRYGYVFYGCGTLPPRLEGSKADAMIGWKYGISVSRWVRCRRKKQGLANVVYLRHGRFFVIMATPGKHLFFEREQDIRDFRKQPLRVGGYSISLRNSKVFVTVDHQEYRKVKDELLAIALHNSKKLEAKFVAIPWLKYTPVRKQKAKIFKLVNQKRKQAGLQPLSIRCLSWKDQYPQKTPTRKGIFDS